MSPVYLIPVLLSTLGGLALGLVAWGFWQSQSRPADSTLIGARGDVLLWLLVLAFFTLGAFITYVLMGFHT